MFAKTISKSEGISTMTFRDALEKVTSAETSKSDKIRLAVLKLRNGVIAVK